MSDPIIWERYDNFILVDIKESLIDKVKQFVVKHYVEENTICQMIKYSEEPNYIEDHNFYLDHIFHDQSSLIIVQEDTDEIVAAAIMKTMTNEMRSWTAIRLVSKSRKLNTLLSITRQMIAEADGEMRNPTGSMHIFELCCIPQNAPEKCTANWTQVMFHGAYRVAQSMQMPALTFVGFSQSEQAAAIDAGYTEVSRVFYPTYIDMDGTHPIPPSDVGETYAVLFYKQVQPYTRHNQLPPALTLPPSK